VNFAKILAVMNPWIIAKTKLKAKLNRLGAPELAIKKFESGFVLYQRFSMEYCFEDCDENVTKEQASQKHRAPHKQTSGVVVFFFGDCIALRNRTTGCFGFACVFRCWLVFEVGMFFINSIALKALGHVVFVLSSAFFANHKFSLKFCE
jgi:hypothetical protein